MTAITSRVYMLRVKVQEIAYSDVAICVEYKDVEGWHVFTSEEVPGLYVAGKNAELAYNDVATSIQLLLELNEGIKCEVYPELSVQKFWSART